MTGKTLNLVVKMRIYIFWCCVCWTNKPYRWACSSRVKIKISMPSLKMLRIQNDKDILETFRALPVFSLTSRCRSCQVLPILLLFPEQINHKIIGFVTGWSKLDFEESAGWMSKECGLVKRVRIGLSFHVIFCPVKRVCTVLVILHINILGLTQVYQ